MNNEPATLLEGPCHQYTRIGARSNSCSSGEQGEDYKDIRIFGLLLEFGFDGVKDFFTSMHKKRNFEKLLAEMKADAPDIELQNCSLAQGRRLLLDALAINKMVRGTTPHKDYRFHLSLIKQLILEAPDIEEDTDIEESINLHDLDPQAVVVNFVEYWVDKVHAWYSLRPALQT